MSSRDSQQRKRFSQAEQQRRANANTTRPPQRRGASRRAESNRAGGLSIPGWGWIVIGLIVGIIVTKLMTGGSSNSSHSSGGDAAIVTRPVPTPAADKQSDAASSDADKGSGKHTRKSATSSTSSSREQAEQAQEQMPSFQFYTLLPKSEVIAPDDQNSQTTMSTPPPTPHRANTASGSAHSNSTSSPTAQRQASSEGQSAASRPASSTPAQNLGGASYLLQAASYRNKSDADTMASRFQTLGLTTRVSQVQTGDGTTWYRVQAGPYTTASELTRARSVMRSKGIEPLTLRQR